MLFKPGLVGVAFLKLEYPGALRFGETGCRRSSTCCFGAGAAGATEQQQNAEEPQSP
jgi:hypothetical protein